MRKLVRLLKYVAFTTTVIALLGAYVITDAYVGKIIVTNKSSHDLAEVNIDVAGKALKPGDIKTGDTMRRHYWSDREGSVTFSYEIDGTAYFAPLDYVSGMVGNSYRLTLRTGDEIELDEIDSILNQTLHMISYIAGHHVETLPPRTLHVEPRERN